MTRTAEHVPLPGMAHLFAPDQAPAAQREALAQGRAYDAATILRKCNCRMDEAAYVLGCSVSQVRNYIADRRLRATVKNRVLDPAPQRVHVAVVVSSLRRHLRWSEACQAALRDGVALPRLEDFPE